MNTAKDRFNIAFFQSSDEGSGGWAIGVVYVNAREYQFEAKHFDEGSVFGINHGRISKLRIIHRYPNKPVREVCAYDRGWVRKPRTTNAADMAVYNAILKHYN